MGHRVIGALSILSLVVCACSSDSGSDDGSSSGTESSTTAPSTSASTSDSGPTAGSVSATGDSGSTTAAATDGSATSGSDSGGSDGSTGTVNDPDNPLDCGGKIWACGDGMDNDGDGHTDLEDPECTGPCDNDEGSYQTGIPGDNVDCKQDCFFDGNSGQGDDGCNWDLTCDPANPGANLENPNCSYTGGMNCENMPPNQTQGCIDFCTPFVPPGCDCFGCCTVQTPDGPVDIFLNGDPECSVDNIEACTECTSQIDICGNPCEPEECEVCFGETEPPDGCDMQVCDNELPCEVTADCPTDYFCYLDCCYPPPPG